MWQVGSSSAEFQDSDQSTAFPCPRLSRISGAKYSGVPENVQKAYHPWSRLMKNMFSGFGEVGEAMLKIHPKKSQRSPWLKVFLL